MGSAARSASTARPPDILIEDDTEIEQKQSQLTLITPKQSPPATPRRTTTDNYSSSQLSESQPNSRRERIKAIKKALKYQFRRLRDSIQVNSSFSQFVMFIALFIIETSNKYDAADNYVRLFKTLVPYAVVSWFTIQVTRLVYAAWPETVLPLYLSFVPFPFFCIFSRETHIYLSTFWLLITLIIHLRRLPTQRLKRFHFHMVLRLYMVLYLSCVWFMSIYFVDTTGMNRFYGHILSINWGDELTALLTAGLVSGALWIQEANADSIRVPSQDQLPRNAVQRQPSTLNSNRYTIPYEELQLNEEDLIGRGSFGNVYRSLYEGEVVAVKKLVHDKISAQEAEILSILSHKYIIRFKGLAYREPHDLFLILDYAENGALYDYLEKCRKRFEVVNLETVVRWTKQIVQGMNYLHYGAPRQILHRDLKSKNILLDKNLDIKISDFGWSRARDELTGAMTNTVGTCAWMAPEVIRGGKYTETVDVWSFGVCLWEILTGQVPYDGLHVTSIMFGVGREPPLLELPIPSDCPELFRTILLSCWQRDPEKRPSFSWLLRKLNEDTDRITQTTYETFAEHQRAWCEEISLNVKNQGLHITAEMSLMDAKAALNELDQREKVIREREQALESREAVVRRREYNLIAGIIALVLLGLLLTAHEAVLHILSNSIAFIARDAVAILSTKASFDIKDPFL